MIVCVFPNRRRRPAALRRLSPPSISQCGISGDSTWIDCAIKVHEDFLPRARWMRAVAKGRRGRSSPSEAAAAEHAIRH